MLRNIPTLFLASLLLVVGAAASSAQDAQKFNSGDIVEAHSYFFNPPWHKAKVLSVGQECTAPKPYRVHFIGPDAGDHGDPCVGGNEIRALEAQPQPGTEGKTDVRNDPRPLVGGAFKVGDRVDVFAADNPGKGARGTIIAGAGGSYKVHYDGCTPNFDAVVDRGDLHPIATISVDAPEIKFLVGSWKLFTPSYPTTVVHGNTIYREYGMGAQTPPLRINADGTYVWYDEYKQPPVKGRWTTDAKVEGSKTWHNFVDGVVIKDSKGGQWKVYRWKLAGDNEDRITVHVLCSGTNKIATRIR